MIHQAVAVTGLATLQVEMSHQGGMTLQVGVVLQVETIPQVGHQDPIVSLTQT